MKKTLFLILPFVALLTGCLVDNIDGPQILAKPTFPPGAVYYKCITGTNNLQILWNPPLVDTQQNFKGYFVKLYNSAPFAEGSTDGLDSLLGDPIDSIHVLKVDTMCTFKGLIQTNRYTVQVWGERYRTAAKPDSLSLGPAAISFNYDSRPVLQPTILYASSSQSNSVSLFWQPSATENQIGMYGYVIRYKDTTNVNAPLLTYPVREPVSDSIKTYHHVIISVPGNQSPPLELPYKFWVKAIRKDSVESDDSVGISWSGAERLPAGPLAVRLDTGIFIGVVGFTYNLVQTDPTQSGAEFKISQNSGNVVVSALPGATTTVKFVNRIDRDTNLTLDNNFFTAPFQASDFTESQLTFPATGKDKGAIIYGLFNNGSRARILFSKPADTSSTGTSYIRSDGTILIQSSFQPQETRQLPFF